MLIRILEPSRGDGNGPPWPDTPMDVDNIRLDLPINIRIMSVAGMVYRVPMSLRDRHDHLKTPVPQDVLKDVKKIEYQIESILQAPGFLGRSISVKHERLIDNLVCLFAERVGWTGKKRMKSQQTNIQIAITIVESLLDHGIVKYTPVKNRFEATIPAMLSLLDTIIKKDGAEYALSTDAGCEKGEVFFNMLFGDILNRSSR